MSYMDYKELSSWLKSCYGALEQNTSSEIVQRKVLDEIEKIIKEIKRQNIEFTTVGEIRFALTRIAGYLFTCNKYNCISTAKRVMNFLTHESAIVRSFAAIALDYVVWFASNCLNNNNDDDIESLNNISDGLSYIRRMLQGGNYHSDIMPGIQTVIKYIDSVSLNSKNLEKIKKKLSSSNGDDAHLITKISSLSLNCDKFNCTEFAKAVIPYLNNESSIIRQLAANAFVVFIKISTVNIINEKELEKIKNFSSLLEEAVNFVDDIPHDISDKVKDAVKFAKLGVLGNEMGTNKINISDEFVNSTIQKSIKRLIGNIDNLDKFLNPGIEEQTKKQILEK